MYQISLINKLLTKYKIWTIKLNSASKSIEKILSVVCKAIQEGLDERKQEKEAASEGSSESTEPEKTKSKKIDAKSSKK